jgi:hypothetical protein
VPLPQALHDLAGVVCAAMSSLLPSQTTAPALRRHPRLPARRQCAAEASRAPSFFLPRSRACSPTSHVRSVRLDAWLRHMKNCLSGRAGHLRLITYLPSARLLLRALLPFCRLSRRHWRIQSERTKAFDRVGSGRQPIRGNDAIHPRRCSDTQSHNRTRTHTRIRTRTHEHEHEHEHEHVHSLCAREMKKCSHS